MPIHHAVLALLSERESYGYELRSEFRDAIGPQWGDLNIGHVYQVLDRLVRDGLATKHEVPQVDRPDKFLYRLTSAGRRELDEWLRAPFVRQGGYRDDFFLKLLAAARLGRDRLEEVLRMQREAYMSELATLTELRDTDERQPLVALLIDAAIRHTKANLDVVEQAEKQADRLVSSTPQARRDTQIPLSRANVSSRRG
jgi:DNA-binding PadR family transcriptional regulator